MTFHPDIDLTWMDVCHHAVGQQELHLSHTCLLSAKDVTSEWVKEGVRNIFIICRSSKSARLTNRPTSEYTDDAIFLSTLSSGVRKPRVEWCALRHNNHLLSSCGAIQISHKPSLEWTKKCPHSRSLSQSKHQWWLNWQWFKRSAQ